MKIILKPITPADGRPMALMVEAAFANDPFQQAGFPPDMTDAQVEEFRNWRADIFVRRAAEQKNSRYLVAFDEESGRLIGVVAWVGPEVSGTSCGKREETRWPGKPSWYRNMDESKALFMRMRENVVGKRKDLWFLGAMAVHPDFQNQGIASQMLTEGLEMVDRDGLECYVESTNVATNLYKQAGFVVKDSTPLFDGTYVLSAMLRPAKVKASSGIKP